MDRERIERRDFPTGRRGYDPAAVDEHLRRVADEFEARAHPPAVSMADSTSEQVRLILTAAERGAAEMRAAAGSEASDHVARVQAAADGMLTKLDALESELTRLLSALRTSGERLVDGLAELQAEASLGHTPPVPAGVDAPPKHEPDPGAPTAEPEPAIADGDAAGSPPEHPPLRAKPGSGGGPDAATEHAPSQDAASPATPSLDAPSPATPSPATPTLDAPTPATPSLDSPSPATPSEDAPSPEPTLDPPAHESPPLSAPDAPDWPAPAEALFDAPAADGSPFSEPDEESARLIALNMALGGSPRDDTRIFLEEHFDLPDIEALLDDVYARAGR